MKRFFKILTCLSGVALLFCVFAPWLFSEQLCEWKKSQPRGTVLVSAFYASCNELAFIEIRHGTYFYAPFLLLALGCGLFIGYQRRITGLVVFAAGIIAFVIYLRWILWIMSA